MIAIPAADGQFLSEAELGRMIAQYGDGPSSAFVFCI